MASADVRSSVLAAMRASPRVDHSLILDDYLLELGAEELLKRSADGLGVTQAEFLALVRELPELEFLVPVTGHRLRWTGSPRIAVAAHWDSDVLDIQAYQPSGERLEVRDEAGWRVLRDAYEALFVVRPRETAGTRIGRQPDVPGPVIQDPGDGQRAAIWRMRAGNGERLSFDVGRYGSVAEFRAAVTEAVETRGVWGLGAGALADIGDPGGDDDGECGGPLMSCPPGRGGGGGGIGGDPWGEPSTYVTRVLLTKQLDKGSDNELFLELYFKIDDVPMSGRWENYDVEVNDTLWPNKVIHPESPIAGGVVFRLHAWEEDPWPNADEDLGEEVVGAQDNGQIKHFHHEGDHALEVTLEWEDETDLEEEEEEPN